MAGRPIAAGRGAAEHTAVLPNVVRPPQQDARRLRCRQIARAAREPHRSTRPRDSNGSTAKGLADPPCAGTSTTAAATTSAPARARCQPGPVSLLRQPPRLSRTGRRGGRRDGVLTWPRATLAPPAGWPRHWSGRTATHQPRGAARVEAGQHGVTVDAFNVATQSVERWQARRPSWRCRCSWRRGWRTRPRCCVMAAARTRHAPGWWPTPCTSTDRCTTEAGAAPSWDNVLYGGAGLGYVDARHQSPQPVPGATVLTVPRALGDSARAAPGCCTPELVALGRGGAGQLSVPHPGPAGEAHARRHHPLRPRDGPFRCPACSKARFSGIKSAPYQRPPATDSYNFMTIDTVRRSPAFCACRLVRLLSVRGIHARACSGHDGPR